MRRVSIRKQPTRRRGVVIVLTVVMLATLLGMAALTIDVGYIYNLRAEAQNTADSGALAGASALYEGRWESAHTWALEIVERNQIAQGFSSLEDQVIEVGRWDGTTATFTALNAVDWASANAVRVVAARKDVPLFFAALMGKTTTSVSREAVALVSPPCGGIWGLDEVAVWGNVMIDSYDSTEGSYSPLSAGSNGDVCSNKVIEVEVSGAVDIHGDVRAEFVDVEEGTVNITGIVVESTREVYAPEPDFGDVRFNNDNSSIGLTAAGTNQLTASNQLYLRGGENLTLAPGTYYFEHIKIRANASLTLTGPTTIYLKGDLKTDGSAVINTTQNAHDLTIISSGGHVDLDGNGPFYGSILAPNADITLRGNEDYFGALVGKNIEMSGDFQFHVDESLPLLFLLRGPAVLVR